jgi:hypothetical protein
VRNNGFALVRQFLDPGRILLRAKKRLQRHLISRTKRYEPRDAFRLDPSTGLQVSLIARRPIHFCVPVRHLGMSLSQSIGRGWGWRRGWFPRHRSGFGSGEGRGRASRQNEE